MKFSCPFILEAGLAVEDGYCIIIGITMQRYTGASTTLTVALQMRNTPLDSYGGIFRAVSHIMR